MDKDLVRWAVPLVIGVLGFLVGGGWPLKAYRKWSDSDLISRMKDSFVPTSTFEAHVRENAMRHQRADEVMGMLHDNQRAILALSGAVERHTEALKFFANDLQEVKDDVERLKEARQQ